MLSHCLRVLVFCDSIDVMVHSCSNTMFLMLVLFGFVVVLPALNVSTSVGHLDLLEHILPCFLWRCFDIGMEPFLVINKLGLLHA